MKALILNSGMGSRMGGLTKSCPKCMTRLGSDETVVSRQLRQLLDAGIEDVVMTTGFSDRVLEEHCKSLSFPLRISFVKNPRFEETNYIYSIYCARELLQDDILLLHGDLVFEDAVLDQMLKSKGSRMAVSSAQRRSQKDFKAVVSEGKITKIGIEFEAGAVAAQPLYYWKRKDWQIWMREIERFCERGDVKCYAESAFNKISKECALYPFDVGGRLCHEIDTPEDLQAVLGRLSEETVKTAYICFSTDVVHSGHIAILKKAARLGRLLVGVLSDEAIVNYKRYPLLPFEERKSIFENIKGVCRVVEQKKLSYKENLEKYRPDYVVHGDDWRVGFQKTIREEALLVLSSYGGRLVEFPYGENKAYRELESSLRESLAMPDVRRGRLKKILEMKGQLIAIEVHSGLTGLIAEDTVIHEDGGTRQFDAMWVSSLCDSTAKGKPDIELVDMTSRFRTIDDIVEVTTKPIIFDGDTGGLTEHFVYTVRTLERMGVSMVIIEDKMGLKKNSLFGNEVEQQQAPIEQFCEKIRAGKKAQRSGDFMICARIESLILENGMEDALKRARAYVKAGADAIMIHSRKKEADEIFEFVGRFREADGITPLVAVPTTFHDVTEEEWKARGVNIVIYANHLTRSGFPAMQNAAKSILRSHRAKECDALCMPFQEIIRLIPEDNKIN